MEGPRQASSFFPGLNLNAAPAAAFADTNALIDPLIANGVGINISTQPADADVRAELNSLVTKLASCGASCATADRTKTITKAACAAVLGSGAPADQVDADTRITRLIMKIRRKQPLGLNEPLRHPIIRGR